MRWCAPPFAFARWLSAGLLRDVLSQPLDAIHREVGDRRYEGSALLSLATLFARHDSVDLARDTLRNAESILGILLAALSVVVMPLLARAKRRLAFQLESGALAAESEQTSLCAYLSAILLGGLVLNATVGWWFADPIAGLAMVPIIVREGINGVRGRSAWRRRAQSPS